MSQTNPQTDIESRSDSEILTHETPWNPPNPMDAIVEAIKANDFERALELYRSSDLEKHRLRIDDIRDVRREWKERRIERGQRRYLGVQLIWTPVNFGGVRPWYVCPTCGHRVALLFRFACRRCRQIRYRSQYDSRLNRQRDRAAAIRVRLGAFNPEIFDSVPSRPPRMRRTTYHRLLDELEAIELDVIQMSDPSETGFHEGIKRRFEIARRYDELRKKYRF